MEVIAFGSMLAFIVSQIGIFICRDKKGVIGKLSDSLYEVVQSDNNRGIIPSEEINLSEEIDLPCPHCGHEYNQNDYIKGIDIFCSNCKGKLPYIDGP